MPNRRIKTILGYTINGKLYDKNSNLINLGRPIDVEIKSMTFINLLEVDQKFYVLAIF